MVDAWRLSGRAREQHFPAEASILAATPMPLIGPMKEDVTETAGPPIRAIADASTDDPRGGVKAQTIVLEDACIRSFEFWTLDLPAGERFAAWRGSYAPMVELVGPDDAAAGFAGRQQLWDLGNLLFSRVETDGLRFESLNGHGRRDPIDHWLITVMLRGSSTTVTPSTAFSGPAGAVQIHPLGRVFEGSLADSEMLQLFVPRDFCRGMAHVLDGAEFSVLGGGMGRLFADFMTSLCRRLPRLTVADLPGLTTATRAMILACIAPTPDHLEEANDQIANVLLERARRFVQANMLDPDLGAASLQRELGVSRSRLYRLFEPHGGVVHYIQHRRLLDAYAALADPNDHRRILDIAEERGFTDGAEFSRAFKREFGYSPSEVRAPGGTTRPSRVLIDLGAMAPADRLGALLHRLQA
jgi:AraC-like DNA-binding protein